MPFSVSLSYFPPILEHKYNSPILLNNTFSRNHRPYRIVPLSQHLRLFSERSHVQRHRLVTGLPPGKFGLQALITRHRFSYNSYQNRCLVVARRMAQWCGFVEQFNDCSDEDSADRGLRIIIGAKMPYNLIIPPENATFLLVKNLLIILL